MDGRQAAADVSSARGRRVGRRGVLASAGALAAAAAVHHPVGGAPVPYTPWSEEPSPTRPVVAAYYFPNYHPDPRNDAWYGRGWTEWELLAAARPRFPGHDQPRRPAWGPFDESDPYWAARQIDLAADHGVGAFLFDWYSYEDGPYLQGALERGFLRASNARRLKFGLMWANHDWGNLFPARAGRPVDVQARGAVSPATFDRLTDYVVGHYFSHQSYLTLDGEPYFSIYDTATFVAGMGGLAQAREALDGFRAKVRAAGFPGLHLNGITWGRFQAGGAALPGAGANPTPPAPPTLPTTSTLDAGTEGGAALAPPATARLAAALGLSSVGSYTWIHHQDDDWGGFPRARYERLAERYWRWRERCRALPLPYHPNVSVGWDSSPRTSPEDSYEPRGYPWLPVLEGNTPAAFRAALARAQASLDEGSPDGTGGPRPARQRLVTINAWNEWTEGSYLLPDTRSGAAYLEAVQDVFGPA